MAKPGRLPDFRKMYPKASEEVIEVLKETERKMQYEGRADHHRPGRTGDPGDTEPGGLL